MKENKQLGNPQREENVGKGLDRNLIHNVKSCLFRFCGRVKKQVDRFGFIGYSMYRSRPTNLKRRGSMGNFSWVTVFKNE